MPKAKPRTKTIAISRVAIDPYSSPPTSLPAGITCDLGKRTGDGTDGLPSRAAFARQISAYIAGLNPRKQNKALITQATHDKVLACLMDKSRTDIDTAQFRFWARKVNNTLVIANENHPVAVKEMIYDVLATAHATVQHGGRDRTATQVRVWYSYIPKELTARFVKICPTCTARRNGDKHYFATSHDGIYPPTSPTLSPQEIDAGPIELQDLVNSFEMYHNLATSHAGQQQLMQDEQLAELQARNSAMLVGAGFPVPMPAFTTGDIVVPSSPSSLAGPDHSIAALQLAPPIDVDSSAGSYASFPSLPEVSYASANDYVVPAPSILATPPPLGRIMAYPYDGQAEQAQLAYDAGDSSASTLDSSFGPSPPSIGVQDEHGGQIRIFDEAGDVHPFMERVSPTKRKRLLERRLPGQDGSAMHLTTLSLATAYSVPHAATALGDAFGHDALDGLVAPPMSREVLSAPAYLETMDFGVSFLGLPSTVADDSSTAVSPASSIGFPLTPFGNMSLGDSTDMPHLPLSESRGMLDLPKDVSFMPDVSQYLH